MSTQSPEYIAARDHLTRAEQEFIATGILELSRHMPEGVNVLVFVVNDTPRLAFEAYRDASGEEFDAEAIDEIQEGLFDAIEEIATELELEDYYSADNWLMKDPDGAGRWIIERTA